MLKTLGIAKFSIRDNPTCFVSPYEAIMLYLPWLLHGGLIEWRNTNIIDPNWKFSIAPVFLTLFYFEKLQEPEQTIIIW